MPEMPTQPNGRPVQWVNVNGGEPPAGKPPIPKRARVAIFVGGCVLGCAIIGLFMWSIFGFSIPRQAAEMRIVEDALEEGEGRCQGMNDPAVCIQNLRHQLASQTGDLLYCRGVEGKVFDDCVALAAYGADDRSLCVEITGQSARERCMDALFIETFGRNYDYETCAEHFNEGLRVQCEQNWVRNRAHAGDCSSEHVDESLCEAGEVIARAVAAKDPDICEEIKDHPDYGVCIERVFPGDRDFDGVPADVEELYGTSDRNPDTDGDGLTDYEEIYLYGTDPTNADTDGDGFDDGMEVRNGFDPLS